MKVVEDGDVTDGEASGVDEYVGFPLGPTVMAGMGDGHPGGGGPGGYTPGFSPFKTSPESMPGGQN